MAPYRRTGFNTGSLRTAFGAGALRVTVRVGVTVRGLVIGLRSFGMRTGEASRKWPETARSLAYTTTAIPFAEDSTAQASSRVRNMWRMVWSIGGAKLEHGLPNGPCLLLGPVIIPGWIDVIYRV